MLLYAMDIQKIYTTYSIMPSLRTHMYRVAGVAYMICDHISEQVEKNNIITACLLHDMGNIIKFNLPLFPTFLKPEGIAYWQKIKDDYIQKYGNDEHHATLQIARELNVSQRIIELIDNISFLHEKENYESKDFSQKIVAYADMRVEPFGVTSLKKRLADGRTRFNINKPGQGADADIFDEMARYLEKIEEQIFEKCDIQAVDITQKRIQPLMKELKEFEI
jgi:5'-deoxynucleotidase YfbR-like HD superfamily hydrolase